MKKLIVIFTVLALLLTLAGCQKSSGSRRRDDDDDEGGLFLPGISDDAGDADELPMPGDDDDQASELQAGSVDFEYVLVDNSIRNANGDILVSREYYKVVLLGDDPACQSINELIEADCQLFLNSDIGWTVEELEDVVESMYGFDALFNDANATVVHNGNGYISIRVSEGWFMGGVCNYNSYGLTYDLTTGEEAGIEDIMGLTPEEALTQLRVLAAEGLRNYYGEEGLLVEPETGLAEYSLEDFNFYLEGGELVLTFYTYEFACGAAGSAEIHTGIMVGE